MNIVWARTPFVGPRPWIFLAGPTPRTAEIEGWRPEAINIFKSVNFGGTLLVPEDESGYNTIDSLEKAEQKQWEWDGLKLADCVMFWIPRDMRTLPGLTTNVEFGMLYKSRRVVLGAPVGAPHTLYLKDLAKKHGNPVLDDLTETITVSIVTAGIVDHERRVAEGLRRHRPDRPAWQKQELKTVLHLWAPQDEMSD